MLFGSFLAGSSPEGGGAVAFPVFTKGLDVPAPVARTFGLSIQAVGMTVAAISILLFRRQVHRRAVVVGVLAAVVGFLVSLAFSEPGEVFWPSTISTPWVKATFSIILATTSVMMIRHIRHGDHTDVAARWTRHHDVGLAVAALAGGFVSGLTGTGANILVFLFLVVLADVNPKVALPSAIVVMAAVSLLGLIVFGIGDGQLDVEVTGDLVTRVGDTDVSLAASETDLLGLWLAAVPVVAWGAPLGSLAASLVREHQLVVFVAALAAIEVATTFILVTELWSDAALFAYLVTGLVVVPWALIVMRRHREHLFGTGPLPTPAGDR